MSKINLNRKRGGKEQGVQKGGYMLFHKIVYSELGMHSLE
jgi:hypothetical protein